MEPPVKGDVVVVPFPFSDLSNAKRRPSLVLSSMAASDLILCQITSKAPSDDFAVQISIEDARECGLERVSFIRPNKVFTASANLILYKLGRVAPSLLDAALVKLISILQN